MSRNTTQPRDRAFPVFGDGYCYQTGLSKREWIAATILAGIVANSNGTQQFTNAVEGDVEYALSYADELIEQLNQ